MMHKLTYESPRDHPPRGFPVFGVISFTTVFETVVSAHFAHGHLYKFLSALAVILPVMGFVFGIIGIYHDTKNLTAKVGLVLNLLVLVVIGCGGLLFWMFPLQVAG